MKRDVIKGKVEKYLTALGFERGAWKWQPLNAELLLTVGGTIKIIKLKSGMSQRALAFELGRIAGWADFAGVHARKLNGAHDPRRTAGEIEQGIPA